MDQNFGTFEFNGFEPDSGVRHVVGEILERLLGSAPSDASPMGGLRKTGFGFEGTLRLTSRAGIFVAEAVGASAVEAIEHLSQSLFDQIGRWQKRRLLGEAS